MAKKKETPNNEKVRFKLFRDAGKYAEPLTVVLNGKIWRFERGVELEAPKDVYEIIMHSEAQNDATALMIAQKERDWEEKSKNI